MGTLRSLIEGHEIRLTTRVLVGRAVHCGLRLESTRVSGEHAALVWQSPGWQVRDLGSRNGTWVDGQRLASGGSAAVGVGSRVIFGGEQTFEWIEVSPPAAAGVSGAGVRVEAVGAVLVLPGQDNPEITVFFAPGGWLIEDESGQHPAPLEVWAGGQSWRLELPDFLEATVDEGGPRLHELHLNLAVSLDEEHVDTTAVLRGTRHHLEFRAHHYLLVTLARLRLVDFEGGWVEAERLTRMLAIDRRALNVQIFRARLELTELGVQDASGLVERRSGAGLRLGITDVVVRAQAPA